MITRALLLLGGALVLAGCSSQANGKASPTATARPATTSDPSTTSTSPATPAITANPKPTANPRGNPFAAGKADLKAGDLPAAIAAFQTSIHHGSRVADSWAGIGTADLSLRSFPPALKAYQKAWGMDKKNALYAYRVAYAALYSDDFHTAVSASTQYIHMQPKDPAGYHLRFLAYGDLTDAPNQIKDAKKVAQLEPNSASAHNDLGIALANNHQYAGAGSAFRAALKLQPKNSLYWENLGVDEYQQHILKPALADLEKALSLTNSPGLKHNLETAIKYLEKGPPKKKSG